MQTVERDFIARYLSDSERRLLALTDHLTPRQQSFRPSPQAWSITDIFEHLAIIEGNSLRRMEERLQEPAETERQSRPDLDAVILNVVPARTGRPQTPESVRPTGRWPSFGDTLDQFRQARALSLHLAQTTQADVRAYLLPHAFLGDLDIYQWLLFFGAHAERHRKQAQEIKDGRRFPASGGLARRG